MVEKPLLEQIASSFTKFKSSPLTYIVFLIVIGYAYTMYSTGKEKTTALKECQDEQKRLNQKFQEIVFKEKENKNLDSTNHKIQE